MGGRSQGIGRLRPTMRGSVAGWPNNSPASVGVFSCLCKQCEDPHGRNTSPQLSKSSRGVAWGVNALKRSPRQRRAANCTLGRWCYRQRSQCACHGACGLGRLARQGGITCLLPAARSTGGLSGQLGVLVAVACVVPSSARVQACGRTTHQQAALRSLMFSHT